MSYTPRLTDTYKTEIVPELMKKFEYASIMQAPKIEKICLNQRLGKATSDKKIVDMGIQEMTSISGQKAIACLSKKDVSNFKLRKGMPIATKVT